MIARTVEGKVVKRDESAQLPYWAARDEWGSPIVLAAARCEETALEKWFRAADAFAAAELAVEWMVDRFDADPAPTVVEVRVLPSGDWMRLRVDVQLSVEVEVKAVGMDWGWR